MTIQPTSFTEDVQNFVSNYKLLCVLTLGLAVVGYSLGNLAGRVVAWIRTPSGTTKKADEIARQIVNASKNEVVVHESNTMKVIVPECPLGEGSLQIKLKADRINYSDFQDENHLETNTLIKKIAQAWKKKGIENYLIYAKESKDPSSTFSWEIVPYPKTCCNFWKQFKVLWNVTFGSFAQSKTERERIAIEVQKEIDFSAELAKKAETVKAVTKKDFFCDEKVINKQLVFEGEEINVLYDHAPIAIGKDKLHFLIMPKKHREIVTDVTPTEYLEAMQLTQKLIKYYKEKGIATAYIFDKNGYPAGQTVPHWHEHVVFTATKTEEFCGKLQVLRKMIFKSSPLPEKELRERIAGLKKDLAVALA